MKKKLTQEQRDLIDSLSNILHNVVGDIRKISLKTDEYSYVEFTKDKKRYLLSIEALVNISKKGNYDTDDAIYLNTRKPAFKRMLAGEEFTFGIQSVLDDKRYKIISKQ